MYLYLLENADLKKYYIGVTDNIVRRLEEHNTKCNHYTGRFDGSWNLVGVKEYDIDKTYKEESRLKKAKNKKYIYWYFTEGR